MDFKINDILEIHNVTRELNGQIGICLAIDKKNKIAYLDTGKGDPIGIPDKYLIKFAWKRC